ncbi:hypothetical protein [Streptomyces scabiei]|uniref:hypothetical protein n=1 Tax=Streptomyces scabiei TaxID=1930 RepID=UPI00131AC28C|nr:hypothetical protein [Streptomyces scabiei]
MSYRETNSETPGGSPEFGDGGTEVMGRIPRKLRLPLAGALALGLLPGGLTLMPRGQGDHLAANRAQLKRDCGGLLPYDELSAHVPDDVRGTLDEYSPLLHPGQESRSLLNRALGWEGQSGVYVAGGKLVFLRTAGPDSPRDLTADGIVRTSVNRPKGKGHDG